MSVVTGNDGSMVVQTRRKSRRKSAPRKLPQVEVINVDDEDARVIETLDDDVKVVVEPTGITTRTAVAKIAAETALRTVNRNGRNIVRGVGRIVKSLLVVRMCQRVDRVLRTRPTRDVDSIVRRNACPYRPR